MNKQSFLDYVRSCLKNFLILWTKVRNIVYIFFLKLEFIESKNDWFIYEFLLDLKIFFNSFNLQSWSFFKKYFVNFKSSQVKRNGILTIIIIIFDFQKLTNDLNTIKLIKYKRINFYNLNYYFICSYDSNNNHLSFLFFRLAGKCINKLESPLYGKGGGCA